jgi:transcriptional regulator GlxA family with amidase domain
VATRNSSGRCPTDRTADLADLRIGWTDGLPDQLADWEAIADRLTLVENRLAQAAASARPDPRLEAGISLVLGTRGTVRVGAIAELVGLSPRHLSRLWRERVGVGPKLLGRLTRFQRVLRELEHARRPRWAALAHWHGYFDQAHLGRDFRAFAGISPRQYLAAVREVTRHFHRWGDGRRLTR